jgi:hypothetical protein
LRSRVIAGHGGDAVVWAAGGAGDVGLASVVLTVLLNLLR